VLHQKGVIALEGVRSLASFFLCTGFWRESTQGNEYGMSSNSIAV
jgi:hypothetical protein